MDFTPQITGDHSITFGNPNAKLVITGVTNPMCGFCSESFKVYKELISRFPNDILLNIVFNVPANDFQYDATKVAQRFVEIYKKDRLEAFHSMTSWYANRNLEAWFKKYGEFETEDLTTIRIHHNWFSQNGFVYTPATVINSNRFPKKYDITELPLFMDYLLSNSTKKEPLVRTAQ